MSTIPRTVMNRMHSNKPTSVTNILAYSYLSCIDRVLWNCNTSFCTELGYRGKYDFLILIGGINKENSDSSTGHCKVTQDACVTYYQLTRSAAETIWIKGQQKLV